MNPSWFSAVGILVLLAGVANGAALQKRWIPERMSDNDYGYDNQQHQTTTDDLTAYQPNYMSYWTDYYPGGVSGGDYSGMMFRAGGQAPAPAQAMMDPVQQLQYVQAYSYAQQLQQQYPNGVPLPYRPQPSPYQPYQPYQPQPYQLQPYQPQPYQPGADATGRSIALLSLLGSKNIQTSSSPNNKVMHNGNLMALASHSASQPQEVVLVKETQPQQVLEVVNTDESSFVLVDASDIQPEDTSFFLSESEAEQQEAVLSADVLETLEEVKVEHANVGLQHGQVDEVEAEDLLVEALVEALEESKSSSSNTQNSHSQVKDTQKSQSHQEKLTKAEIMEEIAEVIAAEIKEDKQKTKDNAKQTHKIKETKKNSKSNVLKARAQGSGGDYVDPNVYTNYGGESGLVDMASPLDLVYPGAMVPVQSYPPVSPTYYPYAPPNPYSIPQQVYQPSAYSQATSGPYGAPVMSYPGYPTMSSYYNTQPQLRYTRNSAAALPMPFVVKYVYGAVPMQHPQSG